MARRDFPLRAHRPSGRVIHAARISHDGPRPEATTACGRSLGSDYTEDDDHDVAVTCRACRRTGGSM